MRALLERERVYSGHLRGNLHMCQRSAVAERFFAYVYQPRGKLNTSQIHAPLESSIANPTEVRRQIDVT
jgi:hypothetical protein